MKSSPTSNSSLCFHLHLLLWVLLSFVVPSPAQTSPLFEWAFNNNELSTSLATCVTLPIVVTPLDTSTNSTPWTPPFYMIAFVVGGTPVTSLIGTDENNLSWTVTEPAGSEMALNVIDVNGNSGGVAPNIHTVIIGQTTQCVTAPSDIPEFKITANVTKQLSTCQPWGFTITGGVPPYSMTLVDVNSPNITNVTIPFGDDSFTFINRAAPNTQLLGAISDFTGRWADGAASVQTTGSTNTDCVGLVSSSGNSTIIQQQEEAAAKALSQSKHKHTVIVVVSVLFSLLFVIGFILASFFLRKRLKRADDEIDEIIARPLIGSGTRSILSIQGISKQLASAINKTPRITTSPVQPAGGPPSIPSPTTPSVINHTPSQATPVPDGRPFSVSDYNSFGDSPTSSSRSTYTLPLPHFAHFPLTSIRASQNLNRARTGAVTQNRRASGVEAESFHNDYFEAALSDSGSNVLPRSIVLEAGGRRNLVTNSRQLRGSRQASEGSRHFRNSSTTLS